MADMTELAAALLGAQAQGNIAANNPYNPWVNMFSQLGQIGTQWAMKDAGKDDIGKVALVSALSGLGSGYLNQASQNYANNVMLPRYQDVIVDSLNGGQMTAEDSGLPAGLFGSAKNAAKIWGIQQAVNQNQLNQKVAASLAQKQGYSDIEVKQRMAELAIKDPVLFNDFANSPAGQQLLGITPDKVQQVEGLKPQTTALPPDTKIEEAIGLDSADFTPTNQLAAQRMQEYRSQGFDREKAAIQARNDIDRMTANDKKEYELLQEQMDKAREFENMANTVDSVLGEGLNTGWGAGVQTGFGRLFGSKQSQLAERLQSLRPDIVANARPPGVGAMSDPEMKVYLGAGPTLDKTEEFNQEMANRYRQIAQRSYEFGDFAEQVLNAGGTMRDANRLWRSYEKAAPLWSKSDDGTLQRNETIPSWQEFNFKTGKFGAPAAQEDQGIAAPTISEGSTDISVPSVGSSFNGEKVTKVTKIR